MLLGALWLAEGLFKLRAGFGAADIALVADGAADNPRVPGVFVWFAQTVMEPFSVLLGPGIPLLEIALGLLLVLGVGTTWVTLASTATLALYWFSDQLVWQYPVMALLGVVAIMAVAAARPATLAGLRRGLSARRAPGDTAAGARTPVAP
ncbi:hypothetical protein [Brachybacterium sp. FME24]|uniref:hypothetical protein n=1 Tax=Brachybacterium sp. FME24 TaxID=2742605 RepID=UPI002714C3D4|nr:hypothetical protein [Brachybacterium sp. FME24]